MDFFTYDFFSFSFPEFPRRRKLRSSAYEQEAWAKMEKCNKYSPEKNNNQQLQQAHDYIRDTKTKMHLCCVCKNIKIMKRKKLRAMCIYS